MPCLDKYDALLGKESFATARHSMTEPAATAAIDQGCRMLRLPTIRERFAEIAATAEREHHTYLGFLAELVIAEATTAITAAPERRIRDAGFPARNVWRTSP